MKALAKYFTVNNRYHKVSDTEPYRTFYTLADDAPEWLADAVREAHEDELPNDWRYETCYRIALAIDERESEMSHLDDGRDALDIDDVGDFANETADSLTDIYTTDLLAWLAGHLDRVSACDEAANELASEGIDIVKHVRLGQYVTIERMATILATAYVENVTADED